MSSELLDGFTYVPSDGVPTINLDNQRRFYINSTARRLLDVKPYDRLAVMYKADDKALAIVKPRGFSPDEAAHLATSNFNVDKRYYMSARHFAKTNGYNPDDAPYHFVYERGASDGTAFVFRLVKE